jgi:rhodanese-related sulfurtransferase
MTMQILRAALAASLMLSSAVYAANALAQAGAKPGVYADEDRDWGVPPATQLRTVGYHEPTPTRIPGGKVVTTVELKALMEQPSKPYIIDVLGGGIHRTIAGAIAAFAGGDKNRPLVFFCVDPECWLSYNAALRSIALGYTNVMWYRGGIAAWRVSEGSMTQSDPFFW